MVEKGDKVMYQILNENILKECLEVFHETTIPGIFDTCLLHILFGFQSDFFS